MATRMRRGGGEAGTTVRETHFHHSRMRDSISVQKRNNKTLDDEDHEANSHLQDFLIPKTAVHVASAELNLTKTIAELELEDYDDDEEDEEEEEKKTSDVDAPAAIEETNHPAKPTLARPSRSILHDADCKSRMSCETTEKRRRVGFDKVVVRDYAMILGDHPNCTYGPPVTLEWDYLEYEALTVDEYENHHSLRRPLRLLGLNYYRRKAILTENMGYSEDDLKGASKEVKRAQFKRSITRTLAPLQKVDFAIESARRKAKRMINKEKKSV
mmetsp:Transcript_1882/g.4962  ORF Transcript_1882/g.4962 Transcript_1882/m.4962 type:complete len:271 (-) Transcript_1882:119-931(-)|eukprot:CAMPEP_0113557138 /NCGR_PEP_ID=MMETSP0015_2-20120614/17627_1 /TAXON_ID=2838 /ORGANISM="Odontella" /LENGTH=270 /DNA_ID=CAMNT_0000458535 /DNA_START=151 /DNA_END=963 /DNA_ORIENTATION=- /assembly_acc=CAM_ASM_000160